MNLTDHTCYRDILKNELERRSTLNPSYSLRAFARDLNVRSARLSNVLSGKIGLSLESAKEWVKVLNLSQQEEEYFCDLVASQHSRRLVDRQLAKTRLLKYQKEVKPLDVEYFKVISDWYHFAILELTYIKSFSYDSRWIAKSLGISELLTRNAISRMLKLGMLEERDGTLVAHEEFSRTTDGIPSEALKKFHEQVLDKAKACIRTQSVSKRDVTNLIFSFDEERTEDVKMFLKNTRRKFIKEFCNSNEDNEVYCLAMQFFSLTNKTEEI